MPAEVRPHPPVVPSVSEMQIRKVSEVGLIGLDRDVFVGHIPATTGTQMSRACLDPVDKHVTGADKFSVTRRGRNFEAAIPVGFAAAILRPAPVVTSDDMRRMARS